MNSTRHVRVGFVLVVTFFCGMDGRVSDEVKRQKDERLQAAKKELHELVFADIQNVKKIFCGTFFSSNTGGASKATLQSLEKSWDVALEKLFPLIGRIIGDMAESTEGAMSKTNIRRVQAAEKFIIEKGRGLFRMTPDSKKISCPDDRRKSDGEVISMYRNNLAIKESKFSWIKTGDYGMTVAVKKALRNILVFLSQMYNSACGDEVFYGKVIEDF